MKFRRTMPAIGILSLLVLGAGAASAVPPVAVNDSFVVAPGDIADLDLMANDNANGATIELVSNTDPTQGFLSCDSTGLCLYIAPSGFLGRTSFSYTVANTAGEQSTASVSVQIGNVANNNPTAVADALNVDEDTAGMVAVLTNDRDADGDTLAITGSGAPANGSASCTTSGCTYTPATNYSGPDSFTYTISDGFGGSATGTVNVTVNAVNDAPAAVADALTLNQDSSAGVNVLTNDTDIDNDVLSASVDTQPAHGAVTCAAATCTYTPLAGYSGADSFTYAVSDGNGGRTVGSVSVTVNAVATPPPPAAGAVKVTLRADAPTSRKGSSNGYTVTITNPNAAPVVVARLSDCLPKGFSYLRNSAVTGALTVAPRVAGGCGHGRKRIVWTTPFTVPANATASVHFKVHVGGPRRVAFNTVRVAVNGMDTVSSGPSAPIKVTNHGHDHRDRD